MPEENQANQIDQNSLPIINGDAGAAAQEPPLVLKYNLMSRYIKMINFYISGGMVILFATAILHRGIRDLDDFWVLGTMLIPIAIMWIIFFILERAQKAEITLGPQGLTFNKPWEYELLHRRSRQWSDIHSVQITYPENMGMNGRPHFTDEKFTLKTFFTYSPFGPNISIDFKSGGSATFVLPYLSRPQAESLFNAIERYGDKSKFTSEYVKLQKSIVLESLGSQSYTRLMDDDLNTRYISTNYVPLPSFHSLQDGRYNVVMELAAGGMSAVYLAKGDNGAKVVLKESVLPADISDEQKEKARELFEREARYLLKLKHPRIARVLDRFVEDGRDYLVLEFIPGPTLRQLVKSKGKQKEKDALRWCKQLADILEYLHGQEPPVLHRDLTPDNVILGNNGEIYLVDFGAANEYVGQATGTMIGKQCYIAPEQLRGKANKASDYYALGGTLYFLLTGEDPEPLSASDPKEKAPEVSDATSTLVKSLTAFEWQERATKYV